VLPLPESVESSIVTVAVEARIPPPIPLLPSEMVRPLTWSTVPSTSMGRHRLLPEIVRFDAPGPSMVRSSVIFGVLLASVMVPVTEKLIVSAPAVAFAWLIASRSDPAPESARVVTEKVAAEALGGKTPISPTTSPTVVTNETARRRGLFTSAPSR